MATPAEIQVLLFRSGRTAWDEARRVQGRNDLPLTDAGRADVQSQVRDAVSALSGPTPGTIYCATDEASVQTAEILAGACSAKVRRDADLSTMSLGLWEGLLESEIEERFPSACRQWLEQPARIHPPEGEPFGEAVERVLGAVRRILEKANGRPVSFVLRPLPFAMTRCGLGGRAFSQVWSVIEDGPSFEVLRLDRSTLRETADESRARA